MNIEQVMESWPPELREAVKAEIRAFWDEDAKRPGLEQFDYVNRMRVARADDPVEVAAFKKVEDDGCCGSHKAEWNVNGVKIIYGFNYGH